MRALVTCALCGVVSAGLPLTWTMSVEVSHPPRQPPSAVARRLVHYYCEVCSRANVRSMEAGLDPQQW